MINTFHMNPWMYLVTLGISIATLLFYTIVGITGATPLLFITPIFLLIILILLVYLYINNVIGLPDMILLMIISILALNPAGWLTGAVNIILIPIVYFLSLHFRK